MVTIKDMVMPHNCDDCPFLDDNGDYPTCIITRESRGYNFNIRAFRMPNCPLEEIDDSAFKNNSHTFYCRSCGRTYFAEGTLRYDDDFDYHYRIAKCPNCGEENEIEYCSWR